MAKGHQLSTETILECKINERGKTFLKTEVRRKNFLLFFLKIEEEKEGEKKEKSNVLSRYTREWVGTTLSGSRKFFQNSDVLKLPHTSPIA